MQRALKILSHPAWAGIGVLVAVILFLFSDVIWAPADDERQPKQDTQSSQNDPTPDVEAAATPPGCAPRPEGDHHSDLVKLSLSDHSLLTRAGAACANVAWVIERDGEQRLQRNAANELQYRYFAKDAGLYCAHVRCTIEGRSQRVSRYVTYSLPE